jgi:PKD repeat protein
MKNLKRIICTIAVLMMAVQANAQLTGWQHKDLVSVTENAGKQVTNYQVLLTVNTEVLISANKMEAAGNDIRFAKDCAGVTLYDYWIESDINTNETKIWVMIDELNPNETLSFYMFYGNATEAAASNFDNTFPGAVIATSSTTLTGVIDASWYEIPAGVTPTVVPGTPVVINARKIIIAGTLNGNGAGYAGGATGTSGNGPGAGEVSSGNNGTYGAGGGGYGGNGGNGGGTGTATSSNVGQGGLAYGTLDTDTIIMGSGGGGSVSGGAGGAGGAAITINADVVDIAATGIITAIGSNGIPAVFNGSGAPGSGGGIKINGNEITFNGKLYVNGGNGESGAYGSGGGAGGRIKIFSDASYTNAGTMSVAGGSEGAVGNETVQQTPGEVGTTFEGPYTSGAPTSVISPVISTVEAGPDETVCDGTAVTLTGSGATTYAWDNGVSDGVAFTPTATTTYTLTGTDDNGCSNTDTVMITVNNCSQPTASFTPSATTICLGDSVTFTDNSTGTNVNGWNWTFESGNPTTATTQGPHTIQYSAAGSYTVTLLITDDNGTDETTMTITVNSSPTVEAGTDQAECTGTAVTLTASGTATSYTWDNGVNDGEAFTPTATNTYTVIGTDDNGCSNTSQVVVTVTTVDTTTTVSGNTITANASPATYQWLDCGTGNSISGETAQTYTPTTSGNYAVIVTQNSCIDTSACVNMLITGINETSNKTVQIYPNPVRNTLHLNLGNSVAEYITLLNIQGKIVYQTKSRTSQLTINLEELSKGVYFLKVVTAGEINTYKIIKE